MHPRAAHEPHTPLSLLVRKVSLMVNARERSTGHGKGRASDEAIEKRRAARALNALFSEGTGRLLDGRQERRRQRLLQELREGKRGAPLPPIEVLTHAAELFQLGETLESLKRFGITPRKAPQTPELLEAARRVQAAYEMPSEVFGLLGLSLKRKAPKSDQHVVEAE